MDSTIEHVIADLQARVDQERQRDNSHAKFQACHDFQLDHPEFTKRTTLLGCIDNLNMQKPSKKADIAMETPAAQLSQRRSCSLFECRLKPDNSKRSMVELQVFTHFSFVTVSPFGCTSVWIAIQQEAKQQLSVEFPQLQFSETWIRQHFDSVLYPPHDPLGTEAKPREVVIDEFKIELEQVYAWRLRFCRQRLGGRLSLEFHSLDYLANFDEVHVPLLPKDESEAWNRSGYTLGFFTFASDRVRPAPIMIAPGRLQAKNENPEYIDIDGKSLPIYYFENDTHKMNELLYKEYLEKAFVPNLPSMPDDRDQDSLVKGLVVGCLADDKYGSHDTKLVDTLPQTKGIFHPLIPNRATAACTVSCTNACNTSCAGNGGANFSLSLRQGLKCFISTPSSDSANPSLRQILHTVAPRKSRWYARNIPKSPYKMDTRQHDLMFGNEKVFRQTRH